MNTSIPGYHKTVAQYREEVRNAVLSEYSTNDSAHGITHADSVCDTALLLAETVNFMVNPKLVIAASYVHDLFSKMEKETRRNHHQLAHDYALEADVEFLNIFSLEERRMVAKACLEHRASWKGSYSGPLSVVIAAADKGMPDLDTYLYRAYQYGVDTLGYGHCEAVVRSLHHINWKFGNGGKARVPSLWETVFGEELKNMRVLLTTLYRGVSEENGIICQPLNGCDNHFEMRIDIDLRRNASGTDLTSLFDKYYLPKYPDGRFTQVLKEYWFNDQNAA